MAASCNLAHLLRNKQHLSKESRAYMAVGVQTAKHVMRSRKTYSSFDVPIRHLPPGTTRQRAQAWAHEFLAAFNEPGHGSISKGSKAIVDACPMLAKRVRSRWAGY